MNRRYAGLVPAVKRPVLYVTDEEFAAETEARQRAQREPLLPVAIDAREFLFRLRKAHASARTDALVVQEHGLLRQMRQDARVGREVRSGGPPLARPDRILRRDRPLLTYGAGGSLR